MSTIAHRELRNQSAEILRRVAAGESFEITNHGRVVAMLVPPPTSPLEAHLRRRLMTAARAHQLPEINRIKAHLTTAQVLADLRGER